MSSKQPSRRLRTKTIALCGVSSAIAAAVMLVGSIGGVGMYAAPMLAGILLCPVGLQAGRRVQLLAYICVSVLSAMLIGDYEQVLMFVCVFGWYPAARPLLEKVPEKLRLAAKLLALNIPAVGAEWLVMKVLAPETESTWLLVALWLMGNAVFILYDRLLPRAEMLLAKRLHIKQKA